MPDRDRPRDAKENTDGDRPHDAMKNTDHDPPRDVAKQTDSGPPRDVTKQTDPDRPSEAMILAAGLGTRLRPLTHETPKALVRVGDTPLLEHVARRVVGTGVEHLVVNVSPHAEMIREFIAEKDGFGAEVDVSEEPDGPLETGGGIKKAEPLFRKEGPFLVHNVDVMTDIPLEDLWATHRADRPLATLAVREADSDRYLVFDDAGMAGYAYGGEEHLARSLVGEPRHVDFLGVWVLEPRIFGLLTEEGKFSIIGSFMRLIREGERIEGFDADGVRWIDVGTHERLEEAREAFGG